MTQTRITRTLRSSKQKVLHQGLPMSTTKTRKTNTRTAKTRTTPTVRPTKRKTPDQAPATDLVQTYITSTFRLAKRSRTTSDENTKATRRRGDVTNGKRISQSEQRAQYDTLQPRCIATEIPIEIFINICKFLPPVNLVDLARVCKLYHGWLYTRRSRTTQDIWKRSRLLHMRGLHLPPPDGMDEISYMQLVVGRGCQFCNKKSQMRKVCWPFRVRCCYPCLVAKTTSEYRIRTELRIHRSEIEGLAYHTVLMYNRMERVNFSVNFFWTEAVMAKHAEYRALRPSERDAWVARQKQEGLLIRADVHRRQIAEAEELRLRREEREAGRDSRVRAINDHVSALCTERGYYRNLVVQLEAYRRAIALHSELTPRAWSMLRNRIIMEYERTYTNED